MRRSPHGRVNCLSIEPASIEEFGQCTVEVIEVWYSKMTSNIDTPSEKIHTLTAEQLPELEESVEFLQFRGQGQQLAHASAAVSAPAFKAIWNNPEDEVYDAL